MVNIAGYCRVSTSMQVRKSGEEYEGSLRDQIARVRRAAGSFYPEGEFKLFEYVEEGRSGKDTKNRPEFQRMIKDIEAGKINVIICAELSRAFRSLKDALHFTELFEKYNVRFICLDFNIDTKTPQGKLIFSVLSALYQMERELIAERLRDQRREKTSRGIFMGGTIPYGYDPKIETIYVRGTEQKKIVDILIHPEESQTVEWMYREYLQCGSMNGIAEKLNSQGITTKTGNLWQMSSVCRVLENVSYIGHVRTINNKTVKGAFPPIIDESLFNEVQKLIAQHREHRNNTINPRGKKHYLFSGVLKCHCGAPMTGHAAGGRFYYRCKKCHLQVRADKLENVLIDTLNNSIDKKELFENAINEAKEKDKLTINELRREKIKYEKQIKKNQREKAELVHALAKAESSEVIHAINDEIKRLSMSGDRFDRDILQIIDEEMMDVDYSGQFEKIMKKVQNFKEIELLEPIQKKEIVRDTLKSVIVNRENLAVTLNSGDNFIKPHSPRIAPA